MSDQSPEIDIAVDYTVNVVASYLRGNHLAASELPALIASVHVAIVGLNGPATCAAVEKPSPAEVRKSIRPEGLVSFLDGRSYKSLKRHLTANGVTPEGYRARFGLPVDYPLVAADYSAKRSALSKAMGLGRNPQPLKAVA